MNSIISVSNIAKTYGSGFVALKEVSLNIRKGEIFALLGPNGAGKSTLINIICGIVNATSGSVSADGFDITREYRKARSKIGLVPQELASDIFESVWSTVKFMAASNDVISAKHPTMPISNRCCATCRYGTKRTVASSNFPVA